MGKEEGWLIEALLLFPWQDFWEKGLVLQLISVILKMHVELDLFHITQYEYNCVLVEFYSW